ncbi:anti-sigma factor family protein [Thermodesulfobacteriota bacterium]
MDCTKFQKLLSAYWENDLESHESDAVDTHLKSCVACSDEWHLFQQTMDHLHALEEIPIPRDLRQGILDKLEQPSLLGRFFTWFQNANPTMSFPAAVATLVIAFTSMTLYKTVILDKPLFPTVQQTEKTTQLQGQTKEKSNSPQFSAALPQKKPSPFIGAGDSPSGAIQTNVLPHGLISGAGFSFASTDTRQKRSTGSAFSASPLFNHYIDSLHAKQAPALMHADLVITVRSTNPDKYDFLLSHLIKEQNWATQVLEQNVFMIFLSPGELPQLQNLFAKLNTSFSPPVSLAAAASKDRDIIRVAIKLR